jgi:hypothetical protein
MKRIALLSLMLCVVTSLAFAQDTVKTDASVTISGIVIDNLCADANKATLAEFVKTHPKSCALLANCAASGYSILSEGKLSKFDKESSAKVEEFLKKDSSKLEVVVVAKKVGEELSLVSIENQKEAAK